MQANSLKTYLQHVLETEKNIYTLTQSTNRMYNYVQKLGQAKSISSPQRHNSGVGSSVGRFIAWAIAGLIVGLIVGGIIGMNYSSAHMEEAPVKMNGEIRGYIKVRSDSFDQGAMVSRIILGTVAGMGAGIFIAFLLTAKKAAETSNANRAAQESYSNAILQDQNRVSRELKAKNEVLNYYNVMINQLAQTKQALDKLYSADIIHPQYRNIIAIASFYQYIDTGRCTTLDGHEGAYNLYESERQMNMIVSKLDTIIERLDEMQSNQYMLYNTINTANNKIDRLTHNSQLALSYASATAANSEIMAYNIQVAAQNTTALKWMEILK